MTKNGLGWVLVAVSIILSAAIIGNSYKYKFKNQDRITVTGLGEEEFTSDLIVWSGWLVERSADAAEGYATLEKSKAKVQQFIRSQGIPDSSVVFMFVNADRTYESIYGNDGSYRGQKFTGYELRQQFTIESSDVESVENTSREISSLLAQGIRIEAWQPDYYYTKLDDLKLELIEKATSDARRRAENIAKQSGGKIRTLANARMGVFQITGANSNEEFSAGGNFNTSSRNKKARVTMRLEYTIK